MSCFSLQKKFIPTSRAWKGFTASLQTKLQMLKQSKPIKNTRKKLTTLSAFLTLIHRPPLHLRREKPAARTRQQDSRNQCHLHQGFPPVYVDELFAEPVSIPVKLKDPIPKTKTGRKGDRSARTSKGAGSSSREVELPQWGVDERAEKFIAMFYEEMRLQRERSLGEYQEMLARGAM